MISFFVPGEPVALGRSRSTRSGHHFTPEQSADALARARHFAQEAMWKAALQPMEGPVRMTLRATFALPESWSDKKKAVTRWKQSKPDLDNILKLLTDACNAVVFRDDAQVCVVVAEKVYGLPVGVTVVVDKIEVGA